MIEVHFEFIGNVEKSFEIESESELAPSPGDEIQTRDGLYKVTKRRWRVDSSGIRSARLLLKQKAW